MATYSTIPAAEEPLVAKPQGKSLKALVAGASVAAPTTSFIKPMYVFNQKLGIQTFDDCAEKCPTIEGNGFKKGQMHIPCITSFDMNAQLLAWVQGKTGGQDKGEKNFVWIGHKTAPGSNNGKWVEDDCEKMQQNQFKGDFVCRNGCSSRMTARRCSRTSSRATS